MKLKPADELKLSTLASYWYDKAAVGVNLLFPIDTEGYTDVHKKRDYGTQFEYDPRWECALPGEASA